MVPSVKSCITNFEWKKQLHLGIEQIKERAPGIAVASLCAWTNPIGVSIANVANAIFFKMEHTLRTYAADKYLKRFIIKDPIKVLTYALSVTVAQSIPSVFVGRQIAHHCGFEVSSGALVSSVLISTVFDLIKAKRQAKKLRDPFIANKDTGKQNINIINLTSANFKQEVEKSNLPVVIDAYATWCPPCRVLAPNFIALGNEMEGKVKFLKFNVDENPHLAKKLEIEAMPTLLFYNGGSLIAKQQGALTKEDLAKKVEEHLLRDVAQGANELKPTETSAG